MSTMTSASSSTLRYTPDVHRVPSSVGTLRSARSLNSFPEAPASRPPAVFDASPPQSPTDPNARQGNLRPTRMNSKTWREGELPGLVVRPPARQTTPTQSPPMPQRRASFISPSSSPPTTHLPPTEPLKSLTTLPPAQPLNVSPPRPPITRTRSLRTWTLVKPGLATTTQNHAPTPPPTCPIPAIPLSGVSPGVAPMIPPRSSSRLAATRRISQDTVSVTSAISDYSGRNSNASTSATSIASLPRIECGEFQRRIEIALTEVEKLALEESDGESEVETVVMTKGRPGMI
jgi:hypothetical protein